MTTTDKLLDAAEYRMRRGGYNAVSFRDLASDTNIKSSSVHYHYPRKEDLGVALVERYSERVFERLATAAANAGTPREKLLAFRSVYRMALTNDDAICLCGLLGAETAGLPEVMVRGIQAFFKANIAWVQQALPGSMSKGERYKRACALVAGHQGALMLATSMADKKLFDTTTKHLIDVALAQD